MKDWLTIKEFSEQTKLSPKALRLYDSLGLLKAKSRGQNNYRYYSALQLPLAHEINKLKKLGFSLDEIQKIIDQQPQFNLATFLKQKLQEQRESLTTINLKIQQLEDLLSSLESEEMFNQLQKEFIMFDLIQLSTQGLERKGIPIKTELTESLKNEVDSLSSPLKEIVLELHQNLRGNKVYLGPGRGSAISSLVLYSLGITDLNPRQFSLIPEIFASASSLWLDVEYSNHKEIGQICDRLSERHNFEIVAFRSPILDIYRAMDSKFGTINFNSFLDTDSRIFQAVEDLNFRGVWDFDWSNQFHAFQQIPKEERHKYEVNVELLKDIVRDRGVRDAEDFMNLSLLFYFHGDQDWRLKEYIRTSETSDSQIPELKNTNGMLLYREDWIRILSRLTGASSAEANRTYKSLKGKKEDIDSQRFTQLKDSSEKVLLQSNIEGLFLKSHMVGSWYHFKRTSLLKYFWGQKYMEEIDRWEQKNGIVYQEFGYKPTKDSFYLKA